MPLSYIIAHVHNGDLFWSWCYTEELDNGPHVEFAHENVDHLSDDEVVDRTMAHFMLDECNRGLIEVERSEFNVLADH